MGVGCGRPGFTRARFVPRTARGARGPQERRGRATPRGRTPDRGNEEQPTIRSTRLQPTRRPITRRIHRPATTSNRIRRERGARPAGAATVERASTRFVVGPAGTRRQPQSPPQGPGLATGNRRTGGAPPVRRTGDADARGGAPCADLRVERLRCGCNCLKHSDLRRSFGWYGGRMQDRMACGLRRPREVRHVFGAASLPCAHATPSRLPGGTRVRGRRARRGARGRRGVDGADARGRPRAGAEGAW